MIDINTIQELLVVAAWLVPLITAIVQLIRTTIGTSLKEQFLPLLSVVVGVILGMLALGVSLTGGFVGLVLGLTASGFYDFGKKTIAGK